MIQLTQKEKADRFDSLQTAFKVAQEFYERRRADADNKYRNTTLGLLNGYYKGLSDGYGSILDDLERWMV